MCIYKRKDNKRKEKNNTSGKKLTPYFPLTSFQKAKTYKYTKVYSISIQISEISKISLP